MLAPPDDDQRHNAALERLLARWRGWAATPLGANAVAVGQALLYLALILLIAWLWKTPEADFRYWGF